MHKQISIGKKISLRLDAELVEGLQDYANRERVPVSYVLRHLVLRFLRPAPPVDLPGPALGIDAGGQGRFAPEGAEARRDAVSAHTSPRRFADPDDAERERVKFRDEACALFDGFRDQGLDMKEAAKRTNFALKAKKHPWAVYELVAGVLRKAGRFRKAKGRP